MTLTESDRLVLTRAEAAARARVGLSTLDRWVAERRFPVVDTGRRRTLIPIASFDAFLRGECSPQTKE
jgi:excisionase family DNA binding protein